MAHSRRRAVAIAKKDNYSSEHHFEEGLREAKDTALAHYQAHDGSAAAQAWTNWVISEWGDITRPVEEQSEDVKRRLRPR